MLSTRSRPIMGACCGGRSACHHRGPGWCMTPLWRSSSPGPPQPDLKRAGEARIDARLKKHGCRRHITWAGQIVSAWEHQSVVVAGTDATTVVLPHLARQLISLRAQRADVATQAGTLTDGPPSLPSADLHARDQGSRLPPSFLAKPLSKDL